MSDDNHQVTRDVEPERPVEAQEQVPQDSPPVDGTVSANNPHPVDEDPEQHIGDEQPDPWVNPEENGWERDFRENAEKGSTDETQEDNS